MGGVEENWCMPASSMRARRLLATPGWSNDSSPGTLRSEAAGYIMFFVTDPCSQPTKCGLKYILLVEFKDVLNETY